MICRCGWSISSPGSHCPRSPCHEHVPRTDSLPVNLVTGRGVVRGLKQSEHVVAVHRAEQPAMETLLREFHRLAGEGETPEAEFPLRVVMRDELRRHVPTI